MTIDHALAPGTEMPRHEQLVEQLDLVRYAGASGDFNRLHWDAAYAASASPTNGVIVHGMLNLAVLLRVVGDWVGGDERIVSTSVSMRAPCPIGSVVAFGARVVELDPRNGTAVLAVRAELPDGAAVIDGKRSRVSVRLP